MSQARRENNLHFACEGASDQRSDNGRDHENAHPHSNQHRTFAGWGHIIDHKERATKSATRPESLQCSTNDHSIAVTGCSTYDARYQVAHNGGEVSVLYIKILVYLAPHGCGAGHDKGNTTVPSDVVQAMERVGDAWNCGGNDAYFNGCETGTHEDCEHDEE